jgi:hypothetical protein
VTGSGTESGIWAWGFGLGVVESRFLRTPGIEHFPGFDSKEIYRVFLDVRGIRFFSVEDIGFFSKTQSVDEV